MAKTMDAKLQLNIDAQIEETCTKIRNAIISTEVSSEMTSECERFISQLEGPLGVAVRSSSNQEDSLGKAFAGQFETHLNVPKHPKGKASSNIDLIPFDLCTAVDITDKIKLVWASLWAPHVILYRRKMNSNAGASIPPKMSVLVQEMVDSSVSGVIFSVNPFGMLTEAMIESYFGQGESLVSGEISPDQFIINRNDRKIVKQIINVHKKHATYGKCD